MNNLIKYQTALDKVCEVSPLLSEESQNELKAKSEKFLNLVQESQYIKVPLVGVFNAGKSSLLNAFTEKPGMLPVDTMPETAVAYELYYATSESVELYREGNKVDSKPLKDIATLQTQPGDIAKVYCTSEPVKKLQERGIILVDMPGIGSGIERHDAAIFNYIHSGTAFVLVVEAEQGSLRGSTIAFMHELSQYGMYPAVLVSKIDKKPEEEVKDIVEYVQYQLKKLGNDNPYVSTVCSANKDFDGLKSYLSLLNPEALVAEKLYKELRLIANSIIDQLKIRIEVRSKDISDVDAKIKKIEEEIANVKEELPTSNNNADTPEKSTQDILDSVRKALINKSRDIAQMVVNKEDDEAIKSVIISTVRTQIISSLKDESEQYAGALGAAVQESIQELASIKVDTNFMNDFQGIIDTISTALLAIPFVGIWAKIAKVLLPFLPSLLNWLFGKSESQVLEEVRQKIVSQCVNQVVKDLHPAVLKMVEDNQKRIQNDIQAELVSKMEKVKEGLQEKIKDANKTKEEVGLELAKLSSAIEKLNGVISELK